MITNQENASYMLATGQTDGGGFSVEVPSPWMTLAGVKWTKGNQHYVSFLLRAQSLLSPRWFTFQVVLVFMLSVFSHVYCFLTDGL